MNQYSNNQHNIQYEDEIDLKEIIATIVKHKKFILLFVAIATLCSIIYVKMLNPTPIYSGNLMIEMGAVQSDNPNQIYFDNAYSLKNIIEKKFDNIEVTLPKKANSTTSNNSILIITSNDTNIDTIKQNLYNVFDYVMQRHKQKTKLFDKYTMTKQIGELEIDETPINTPKKKQIVVIAFVASIVLSLFIAFVIEYIRDQRDKA